MYNEGLTPKGVTLKRLLVALATGNGDLHLENFSVISRVRERCILSRL